MKRRICVLGYFFLASFPAFAQLHVSDAWVRATVPGQQSTGAFMKLESDTPVTFVGASSPLAELAELHAIKNVNGVSQMRVSPPVPLKAGEVLELKPGSYHLMLMNLKETLSAGMEVPLTLIVEDAQSQKQEYNVKVTVRPINFGGTDRHHGHQDQPQ